MRLSKVKNGTVLFRVSDNKKIIVYGKNERAKLFYVVWIDDYGKGSISFLYVERGIYELFKPSK